MKKCRALRCTVAVLAGIGLVTPRCALMAGEKPAKPAIADVVLNESGDLEGAVVSTEAGKPVDGALVTLSKQGKAVAKTTTNENGKFELASVKSGVYELKAGPTTKAVRVWNVDAAPPAASDEATLVVGATVRGQEYSDPYYEMGGVDFFTLGTLVTSAGALAVGIVAVSKINDVEDDVNALASP
jgi:hypothetical protein